MSRALASIMAGEGASASRLTAEQEDAYEYWRQPPYWNFLTGTWPLKGTKTRPAVPIWWTMDQDLNIERPMPRDRYEYARDAILEPIFCWTPANETDRETWWINKSRKVLGTLWVVCGAGAEVIFKDAVSWKLVKGNQQEATDLIVERLRFAINHPNYPAWLRRYRPIRHKPTARFARYRPGSPTGTYTSLFSSAGTNFGVRAAKGGNNNFIIDEAPEVEGLRAAVEAARPGARRIVLIGTPPEPKAKGKRVDPNSVAYMREGIEGKQPERHQRRDDVDTTGLDDEPGDDDDDDADLIGSR